MRAGLEALADFAPDLVLIHDAARAFVSRTVIDRVIGALTSRGGYPGACRCRYAEARRCIWFDYRKRSLATDCGGLRRRKVLATANILSAHEKARNAGRDDFTDDAAILEWAGLPVALVEGSAENVKITTAADVSEARRKLEEATALEPRIGTGFDVHSFAEGSSVWLCGVQIPHTHKLEGHSDADVGLHALTDALLGTIGDGDIGSTSLRPTRSERCAVAFVFWTMPRAGCARGAGRIVNVDVTFSPRRRKWDRTGRHAGPGR